MKKYTLILLLLLANCLFVFSKPNYLFKSKKDKIVVPFKLENNLIIIPVQINNSSTLNFILDTGLKNTIITELSYNDTLKIKDAEITYLQGLGSDDPVQVYESKNNMLSIDSAQIFNQSLFVIMENVFHMSERFGIPIHGIIGHFTLQNFISEIDYTRRRLTLNNRKNYKFPTSKRWHKFPIEIINEKPYINGKIVTEIGDTVNVKLLMDTGASQALWIDVRTDKKLTLPTNNIKANLGLGLNGQITGHMGRVPELLIGDLRFKKVISGFPDSASLGDYLSIDKRNGSIGSDIFRRFKIILDYEGGFVYLKKNSKYNSPFKYNSSGIEIGTPNVYQSVFMVYGVDEKSPAYEAGLKVGDELFSINGEFLHDKKLKDVNGIFDIKRSKVFNILVLRNGKLERISFKLNKIF